MEFKLVEVGEILDYLIEYSTKSKDEDRRKNMSHLLDSIKCGKLIAWHGFVNEFGERALMLGKSMDKWWWAGDESDWEEVTSYYEDKFVNEILEADRLEIKSKK